MSDVSTESQTQQKDGKKSTWLLVIIIVLLLIAVASLIFAFVHAQKDDNISGMGSVRGVVTNDEGAKEMLEKVSKETVPQGYFETNMTNNWVFANGTAASANAYIGNSESNTKPMYVDLTIEETGELIYSSPVIPVGNHVENITLDKNLPAGDYTCILTHKFLNNDYIETGETLRLKIYLTVNQ